MVFQNPGSVQPAKLGEIIDVFDDKLKRYAKYSRTDRVNAWNKVNFKTRKTKEKIILVNTVIAAVAKRIRHDANCDSVFATDWSIISPPSRIIGDIFPAVHEWLVPCADFLNFESVPRIEKIVQPWDLIKVKDKQWINGLKLQEVVIREDLFFGGPANWFM